MTSNKDLIEKIMKLKKEKNAVILVHNYITSDIYEIADYIGDSLDLSRKSANTDADIIVFCGVDFMAECAKILSPGKIVLHPRKEATCPMAAMAEVSDLREKKRKYPDASVVCYINTSTSVKAESDICCTSANAVDVVNSVKEKEVLFVPDRNLGHYAKTVSGKNVRLWNGYCYVHDVITVEDIKKAKGSHPDAHVMVHPECRADVIARADAVCSTGQMIDYAKTSGASEFIVATEEGMCARLKREFPGKKFYPVGGICTQMKEIRLYDVYMALKMNQFEITLDESVRKRAKKTLDRMLELG
ncbi:MAG: quinolinate synthase [Candidatus Nanohalarchaeota archaeon]|nr:MAG: quinolinate synthase [Candidatus Nanohaloarchaeota archaeon]